jgi:hypothetical protein
MNTYASLSWWKEHLSENRLETLYRIAVQIYIERGTARGNEFFNSFPKRYLEGGQMWEGWEVFSASILPLARQSAIDYHKRAMLASQVSEMRSVRKRR